MDEFRGQELKKLYKPDEYSNNEDNGQVTVIGGSSLFHGAPILALKTASRIVDMVFFASPEPNLKEIADKLKANLSSFIWVPWEDAEAYVKKSDSVLIGPGLMRFAREFENPQNKNNSSDYDREGNKTREITEKFLLKYPDKKWVIDAGSLQVMEASWIPEGAILTPNTKEFELLFKTEIVDKEKVIAMAKKHNCVIVAKGAETLVASPDKSVLVKGGNAGLTKGGSGDILAGLTVSLYSKNDALLSACSASFIEKKAAESLYRKVGVTYNADDLADEVPKVLKELLY